MIKISELNESQKWWLFIVVLLCMFAAIMAYISADEIRDSVEIKKQVMAQSENLIDMQKQLIVQNQINHEALNRWAEKISDVLSEMNMHVADLKDIVTEDLAEVPGVSQNRRIRAMEEGLREVVENLRQIGGGWMNRRFSNRNE